MLFSLLPVSFAAPFSNFNPFGGEAADHSFGQMVCQSVSSIATATQEMARRVEPSNYTAQDAINTLNKVNSMQVSDVRNAVFGNDFFKPEWLTVFALHNAFTYCRSNDTAHMSKFGTNIPQVPLGLPTGPFRFDSINDFNAYIGPFAAPNQLDGRFTISVSDSQKIIVLTWRGSVTKNDFTADTNGNGLGLGDHYMAPFLDGTNPIANPRCKTPEGQSEVEFFMFAGFAQVMQPHVKDFVVNQLKDVQARFPTYSLVINGHSLGAIKALVTAFYISKFHPELNFKAVYTFSQPLIGSTSFATWMVDCIGVEKVIRVTAEKDLVPWLREARNVKHPESVTEVYNSEPDSNVWKVCKDPSNKECSAGVACWRRNSENHSHFAGINFGGLCGYTEQ